MARKVSATAHRSSARKRKSATAKSDVDLGSDKLYFKIGEVAEIIGVPPYVLRYWETEFKAVKPQKSRSQQRVYRRNDVAMLLKIKHLLYDKKFTIAGARQQLRESPDMCEAAPPSGLYLARQSLLRLRAAVADLVALLDSDDGDASAADPAEYLRSRGGVRSLLGADAGEGTPAQPLLARPER